jgi:hypothetical protein
MQPVAMSLPQPDGKVAPGRYGTLMPVTPANGFTLICKTKPGSGDAIRSYGARLSTFQIYASWRVNEAVSRNG